MFFFFLIVSESLFWQNIDCSMFFNWRASRFICILRSTRWTASMSNSIRIWVVLMSWDEYHEMKSFVNRSVELSCWDLMLRFSASGSRNEQEISARKFYWTIHEEFHFVIFISRHENDSNTNRIRHRSCSSRRS
jgi:hypothetical protein